MDFIKNIHKIHDSTVQLHTFEQDSLTITGDTCETDIPLKGPFIQRIYIDLVDFPIENLEYFTVYYKENTLFTFDGTYYIIQKTLTTPIQKQKLNDRSISFDIGIIPVLQDMKIRFKVRDSSKKRVDFNLSADYVYTNQTKDGLYIIEQIQKNIFTGGETQYKLDFRNSVKEMYFVYGSSLYSDKDTIQSMKLIFNGIDKTSDKAQYYRLVQPMMYHVSAPLLPVCFYSYSFCLDPDIIKPTGSINMSRIQNILLQYVPNTLVDTVKVYAKSYNYFVVEKNQGKLLFNL